MKVYFATFFYCILTAQLWRAADFVSVAEIIASKVADAAKDLLQGKKEIVKTTADDIAIASIYKTPELAPSGAKTRDDFGISAPGGHPSVLFKKYLQ
uniref:Uncharacterized protein n=1 Tax=Romanomermis culicivorax TaxID=13658 RepID=A0A915KF93_ROMCU